MTIYNDSANIAHIMNLRFMIGYCDIDHVSYFYYYISLNYNERFLHIRKLSIESRCDEWKWWDESI